MYSFGKAFKKICGIKRLKNYNFGIFNRPCSWRSPTLNGEEISKEIIELDACQYTRDLVQNLNISCSTAHKHLKEIVKTCKERILVPNQLSFGNWTQCSIIYSSLLVRNSNVSYLHCIVASDMNMVYQEKIQKTVLIPK